MATAPRKPLTRGQKIGVGTGAGVVTAVLVAFVSQWEGTEYVPYLDTIANPPLWTVCQGITGRHVIPGKTYSKAECNALLTGEIEKHGAEVLTCINRPLTDPQQVAVISWAFNVGTGGACGSTLVRRLNAGEPASAWCPELLRWDRAGGKQVAGLTNRRRAELALCLS